MIKQDFFELCLSLYFTLADYSFGEDFETAVSALLPDTSNDVVQFPAECKL